MASKSKNDLFKSRARELKAAGIANFDLRAKPTEYEKRKARELFNRFKGIMQSPGDYTVKTVSESTARKIDCDKQRVRTKSGKVKMWINNDGGKSVKVNRDKTVTVGKITEGVERKIYRGGKDIFKTAEKLFAKLEKEEKKDGFKRYVLVTIGGNNPFHQIFTNIHQFNFYMAKFVPKDSEDMDEDEAAEHDAFLMRHINLVTVKAPDEFKEGEPNGKKKRKKKISRY